MSGPVFALEERLDLRAAAALATALLALRGSDLELDARAVRQIGALAVQVIRAAAQTWAADGHRLSFEGASIDLADQLALLGFTSEALTRWQAQP